MVQTGVFLLRLDSNYNEIMLYQRGLEKRFQERLLLVSIFQRYLNRDFATGPQVKLNL